ncbi:MAG: error-prone DNA polymerase [Nitrospiria bacterium]
MFAELKCKTNYSFLRGASHPEELIHRAAEIGLTAIAITDRDGVYAIPKAYQAIQNHPHLKLIVGADLSLENHPRLTLLSQNRKAYGLLCRILTAGHANRPKGEPLLSLDEFCKLLSLPGNEGLIALSEEQSNFGRLKEIFKSRLFIPLSRFKDGFDKERSERAKSISKAYDCKIVATNDVHYHIQNRRPLQDVFTSIREGQSLTRTGFKLFSNAERYLKSPKEMQTLFSDLPEAVSNTLLVSELCSFSPAELRYRYPSEWIPAGHTGQSYLEELVWKGALRRYPSGVPSEVEKQLIHELSIIHQLQFADYFLTIYEIVDFANQKKILCQGRGSAANSSVCYCLGITAIDPVRMNLLFERFISVERNEPPDIDVDFEHERREEVIQHIYEKYGRERAAMVSAVVTYRRRSAFREISKAFGVEVGTFSSKTVEKEFEVLSKDSGIPNCKKWVEVLSEEMAGSPRHLSIHSGGFTLSADPIIEIVPVEPARMKGRTIIQWDKYDLDILGLLKVDILSLGMLSALRKTLDMVDMKLHEIPPEDLSTYKMIQKGDTVGTFQVESRAQMSMLGRLQPRSFYDLVIEVAIVRPGPIVGQMVHPYLRRRQGLEKVEYDHPKLKQILSKTLGVPLFQEQVMKIAIELAGFTPGEADHLRRAIGAWRSSGPIEAIGKKLKEGLLKNGLSTSFCERIFQQIQGFAQYGFPESHAASFALLAYASCYLKCHYPAEFISAVINSQPMGFYASHTLIDDARRHGVTVYPVDPNQSDWDCKIRNGGIQLGWNVVKGLAKKEAETILDQRPYQNLGDFLVKTSLRQNMLFRLAMGDVFKGFGLDQRHSLWKILEFQIEPDQPQMNLFPDRLFESQEPVQFKKLDAYEAIREDYEAFNLSARGHPMEGVRQRVSLPKMTTFQAKRSPPNTWIIIAGLLLIRQRPSTAKGVTFGTLEDEHGFLDMILWPDVCEKFKDTFLYDCFLIVSGQIQRDGQSVSLLVQSMRPIWKSSKKEEDLLIIEPHQYF